MDEKQADICFLTTFLLILAGSCGNKETVQAAQEVLDALYVYQWADLSVKKSGQLDSLNTSVLYTKRLLEYNSQANYIDLSTLEQNLLSEEMQGIIMYLNARWVSSSCTRGLGGGWKTTNDNERQGQNILSHHYCQ